MAFGDDEAENGSQQSDGDEPEAKRWYVSPRFATHSQVEPYFLVPRTHMQSGRRMVHLCPEGQQRTLSFDLASVQNYRWDYATCLFTS